MDSFECVLALAELRNMTRASEHLFLSQPALTTRIQRLENNLGITIFDRTTRPLSVTPEGQVYIQEMKRIRREEDKLKLMLNEMKASNPLTIHVGIGFNRGRYWLPDLWPLLIKENPQTDYQFREATDQDTEQMLKSGELDYGITGSFTFIEDLVSKEIGKEDIYVCVPANNSIFALVDNVSEYDLQNPYVININDLNDQTLIMGRSAYGLTRYVELLFSLFHVTPGKIIRIGNSETSYQLAAKGLGITFSFRSHFEAIQISSDTKLIPCVLRDIPLQRSVFLLTTAAKVETRQTDRLYQTLSDFFLFHH